MKNKFIKKPMEKRKETFADQNGRYIMELLDKYKTLCEKQAIIINLLLNETVPSTSSDRKRRHSQG